MEEPKLKEVNQKMACTTCGAILKFAPGTNHLKCEYCGADNEIKVAEGGKVEEEDFHTFLSEGIKTADLQEVNLVKCTGCGAESSLKPNITSDNCAFCGTSLIIKNSSLKSAIKPKSLLPFKIDRKQSLDKFQSWLKGLWFAPSGLKKYAVNSEKMKGMYIPYWTYDTRTITSYTGERGIDRQEVEHYTTTENGREVHKTRTVTVTDWYFTSGTVYVNFDDLLVNASKSLPTDYADNLEPWDLSSLVPYTEEYLSGFQTESYQVDLKDGFEKAKRLMDSPIRSSINSDIGGDRQRIHSMNVQYNSITFKHVLLPIWISAYRYNGKVYRFLVNGRTGEVQGERPYSWLKITGAIILGIILIWGLFAAFGG